MVGRVLLQHPVAHAAKDRLLHDLRSVPSYRPLDVILAEALVAQNQTGFRVPARQNIPNGVTCIGSVAQPLVMRIGSLMKSGDRGLNIGSVGAV
jgi:hypothetical protein